jgi:hypothetical protein
MYNLAKFVEKHFLVLNHIFSLLLTFVFVFLIYPEVLNSTVGCLFIMSINLLAVNCLYFLIIKNILEE